MGWLQNLDIWVTFGILLVMAWMFGVEPLQTLALLLAKPPDHPWRQGKWSHSTKGAGRQRPAPLPHVEPMIGDVPLPKAIHNAREGPSVPRGAPLSEKPTRSVAVVNEQGVLPHNQWWPLLLEAPHVRLIGPTQSGKSVIAQAAASEYDGKLLIIDPVWRPGNWGGLQAVTVDDDGEYGPIAHALDAIIAEMKERAAQLKQGKVDFERLTILFDEVPDTVAELPDKAGLLVRRLGQRGRHSNIHLVGMGQSERVKAWGIEGFGDCALNFATVYLGTKALEMRPELADIVAYPAILEWRGKQLAIDTGQVLQLSQRPISADRLFHFGAAPQAPAPTLSQDARTIGAYLKTKGGPSQVSHRELERHLCDGRMGGAHYERVHRALDELKRYAATATN